MLVILVQVVVVGLFSFLFSKRPEATLLVDVYDEDCLLVVFLLPVQRVDQLAVLRVVAAGELRVDNEVSQNGYEENDEAVDEVL